MLYSDEQQFRDAMRMKGEDVAVRPDPFDPYSRTETMAHYWRLEERNDPDWEDTHDHHDEDEYFDEDADRHDADHEAYCGSL